MPSLKVEYLQLSSGDCPCTLLTCPFFLAELKLAHLYPRDAVIEAAKEKPTSPFVLKVARAVMLDECYRRSGAATMFIRHILEGKAADGKAHWDYAILGLINIFGSITEAKSEVQDAGIHRELFSAYPKIIEVISKDFNFLTGSGKTIDYRRAITCSLIGCFANEDQMKRTMYDKNTLKILLHCWLHIPLSYPGRIMAVAPAELIFHPIGSGPCCECEYPPDYMTVAFESFEINTFVSRVDALLKNKKLLGTPLVQELNLIGLFMQTGVPVFLPLLENNIHKQVTLAMRRQLTNQEAEDTDGVIREGGVFLLRMLMEIDDSYKMTLLTDLLSNTCFAEVGAAAFKISSKTGSATAEPWFEIFELIQHSMTCQNPLGCHYHATPDFIAAAQTSLERLAIQTLLALEEDVDASQDYITLWRELLTLLCITPWSIRERYRLDKKCCSLDCPARRTGIRHEKKHVCIECRAVWYCDSVCQKNDWQIHKTECTALSDID